jgi:molybdopterin-guanine dinucleotide biosynthesis protein A
VVAGLVLAGGAGRRMGGRDKAALVVGGVSLLDRILIAARPVCDRLVVVGPVRPTSVEGVTFVQEAEPGGGPVPAVVAGLAAVPEAEVVLVLAVDLPLLRADDLRRLVAALAGTEAAAAADQGGTEAAAAGDQGGTEAAAAGDLGGPNPLLAAYAGPALRARAARLGAGARAAALLPPDVVTVDLGRATLNVNRPEDLAAAESAAAAGDLE